MSRLQTTMRAKKSLGQNFLRDEAVLEKIIAAAGLKGDETVVEVGAGDGFLTEGLKNRMSNAELIINNESRGKILALEFDYRLVEKLRARFKNHPRVKIIHQDALKFDWEDLPRDYVVVANLPYQITSPLINLWTTQLKNQPHSITIMVQKEVAERLTAPACSRQRGLTTILVELYGAAEIVSIVPAKAFYPVPKVESAIIHIKRIQKSKIKNQNSIIAIAKAGFSNKRRTLENSLSGSLRLPKSAINAILKKAGINPMLRAEELSIQQWKNLAKNIKSQILDLKI